MTLFQKCTKSAKGVKTQKSLLSLLWNGKSHCIAIIRVWKHSSSCTRIVLLVTKLVQTDPTSTNDPVPKMYQKYQRGSKLRKVYSHYSGTVNRTATLLCAFDSTDQTVPEECVRWPNWLELTPLRQMTLLKKCTKNTKKCQISEKFSLVTLEQ